MTPDPLRPPLHERIVTALQALVAHQADAVIVSEPQTATTPMAPNREPGRLRQLLGRIGVAPVPEYANLRYVQFAPGADPGTIYAECVGSSAWGGPWEISANADQQLRGLGWLSPADPGYAEYAFGKGAPMYRASAPEGELGGLAELAKDSLGALGVTAEDSIEVETV